MRMSCSALVLLTFFGCLGCCCGRIPLFGLWSAEDSTLADWIFFGRGGLPATAFRCGPLKRMGWAFGPYVFVFLVFALPWWLKWMSITRPVCEGQWCLDGLGSRPPVMVAS